MQQLKTKRVGIYVRVSTEMQSTEGYSIDGQINQIKSKNTVTSIILKLKIYTLTVVFQVNL